MRKVIIIFLSLICYDIHAALYERNTATPTGNYIIAGTPRKLGMLFTTGTTSTNESIIVTSIRLNLVVPTSGVNIIARIYNVSGGYPTGSAITTNTTTINSFTDPWDDILMTTGVLNQSTTYVLVLESATANEGGVIQWYYGGTYSGGSGVYYNGTSWSTQSNDYLFEIYGRTDPIITSQPISNTKCVGTSNTFTVVVDAISPTYQWRKGGTNISGATSSSYTIPSVAVGDAGSYDCVITESLLGTTATTNTVTLTVHSLTISLHPASQTECEGTNITFNVSATGDINAYQWFKDDVPISGATSEDYSITGIDAGDEAVYHLQIIAGSCGATNTNDAVLLVAENEYSTLLDGLVSYWGFNGTGTYTSEVDEHGTNNGTVTGVERLGSDTYRSQYGYFNGNSDYITLASSDTRTVGTYSFWVYPTDRGDDRLVMGGHGYQTRIFLTNINGYVRVETNTNGQEFQFNYSAPPLNQWSHIVLVRNGNSMSYYLDGGFIGTETIVGANSVTITQIGFNGRSFRGNLDEIAIYNRVLTAGEILLHYDSDHGIEYSLLDVCTGGEIPLVLSGRKKVLLASKARNVLVAGIERDFGGVTGIDPLPEVIYFYENFELLPSLAQDTLSKYWRTQRNEAYWPADQSIYDIGGNHGKVWRSIFKTGASGGESGFDFTTFFSETLNDELWVTNDLWCDPNWTGYGTGGGYSGKILNGLFGGGLIGTSGQDTSATGWGWRAHGVWGSGTPNALRPYWYSPQGGFFQWVAPGLVAPRNYWINVTKYVKLNTPGHKDGIFALFIDDVLSTYVDTILFRSASQYNSDNRNNINGLILKYMFGGGSGIEYESTRDNEIRIDNIMAWNYAENSPYNFPESPTIGMEIVKPSYPASRIYQTDSILYNRTYTAASDTIFSNPTGSFFSPDGDAGDARLKNRIYTTRITVPSGNVDIVFMKWDDGYNESGTRESWTKIYTVTGGVRTLYRYYQEPGEQNGIPSVGSTITPGTQTIDIDYYPGSDYNGGWKLRYF